jgi:Zn-dependent protease/predicted transcriptional regulator
VFGNSWRLGRLAGIDIRVDTSWVLIALLLGYSLYTQFLGSFRGIAQSTAALLAFAFAILFFGSVLAHEMAHALVARARGIPVHGITLFLFGGATHAKVESKGPKDEFLVSVVGPLSSLALGGAFLGLGQLAFAAPIAGGIRYLGGVNIVLAIFNLLPGFPLDGGRVLRSAVWRTTGSLTRATIVASVSGQIVGYMLVGAGLLLVFVRSLFSGVWLASIGWFLAQAARSQYEETKVRRALEDVRAEDVMAPGLMTLPANLSLRDAVESYLTRNDHPAAPVVDESGRSIGLLTLRAAKNIPQVQWTSRTARDAMEPLGDQCTVDAETRMDDVLSRLQENESRRCLVLRDGEVVGILTANDVARWFQRNRSLRT